jgi:sigma-B regulation protein RsbU (phosphoserine phosphatase)
MKTGTKIFTVLSLVILVTLGITEYIGFSMVYRSIASTMALLLLTVSANYILFRTLTQPLDRLTNKAIDFHSNLSHSEPQAADREDDLLDEFGELTRAFERMEWELVRSSETLNQITVANTRMENELQIGREIQMNMLTLTLPKFPNRKDLDLYATLLPAREVGGDFYDFYFFREHTTYLLEESHFFFCIGDVSGKGVPAALFMAVVKFLLQSQSQIDLSPAQILTSVNQTISVDNPTCMFATVFLGVLNLTNGELIYTNAGHNPPYIRRQEGLLEKLPQRHGPVIGAMEDLIYQESKTRLKTGDIVIIYTDGVTEAMDNENRLFSDRRLVDLLEFGEYHSPKEAIDLTIDAIAAFQGNAEQADDIAMLCLQFCGGLAEEGKLSELVLKDEVLSSLRDQWE